ncbi:MAG TPA: AmmeMemoRadiSam system protein B [Candidatus Acidoferrales bacterium]|nr:AmmeMemoRadiSam system protein B [Candidatus Acidoferrales bacterium]
MKIREPAVAGKFYPGDRAALSKEIDLLLKPHATEAKQRAIACMAPHAGYVYSGGVAANVFSRIDFPPRIIVLGPRHFPRGAELAINSSGAWRTPLGVAEIDEALAAAIVREFPAVREDDVAHSREHSLEVEIPFLQVLAQGWKFVPIAIGTIDFGVLSGLGEALARVIAASREPALIVASSDMNHYEPDDVTRAKDRRAIERLLALDARGLLDTVRSEGITMCGVGPAVATIIAAKNLGPTRAELVQYATSGDAFGDRDEVVGYAGMIFS